MYTILGGSFRACLTLNELLLKYLVLTRYWFTDPGHDTTHLASFPYSLRTVPDAKYAEQREGSALASLTLLSRSTLYFGTRDVRVPSD